MDGEERRNDSHWYRTSRLWSDDDQKSRRVYPRVSPRHVPVLSGAPDTKLRSWTLPPVPGRSKESGPSTIPLFRIRDLLSLFPLCRESTLDERSAKPALHKSNQPAMSCIGASNSGSTLNLGSDGGLENTQGVVPRLIQDHPFPSHIRNRSNTGVFDPFRPPLLCLWGW